LEDGVKSLSKLAPASKFLIFIKISKKIDMLRK
jgi:hypothetical protein